MLHLLTLQAVEFLILSVNSALLIFLFLKARKMLYLLKLYVLYLVIMLASSNIIVTPQILIGFILLSLIYHFIIKDSVGWGCEQVNDSHWLKNCVRVVLFYWLLVLIRYCVLAGLRNVSVECSILPPKPLLTAHRGCKDVSICVVCLCVLCCLHVLLYARIIQKTPSLHLKELLQILTQSQHLRQMCILGMSAFYFY